MRVAVLIASIVFITCANYACAYSIVITTIHNTTIYNRTDAIIYTSTEKSPVYKYLDNNIYRYIRQPIKILAKIVLIILSFVFGLLLTILIAISRGLQHIHDVYSNFSSFIMHHIFNCEYSYIERKLHEYNWCIFLEGLHEIMEW